jgi:hypothetical protein
MKLTIGKSRIFQCYLLIIAFSILLFPLVNASKSGTLECNSFFSEEYSMVRGDVISWSFSSQDSDISVIALSKVQQNTFYNMLLSAGEYTPLSGGEKSDSGLFQAPKSGTFYIYFVNWGMDCEETQISYSTEIERSGLIIWIIVFGLVGVLGCTIGIYKSQQFSKANPQKERLENFKKYILLDSQIKIKVLSEGMKMSEAQLYDFLLSLKKELPFLIQNERIQIENESLFHEKLSQLIAMVK